MDFWHLKDRVRIRQASNYKMLLGISTNPHIENEEARSELWESLQQAIDGEEYIKAEPELDLSAFETLKSKMSNSTKIIVK